MAADGRDSRSGSPKAHVPGGLLTISLPGADPVQAVPLGEYERLAEEHATYRRALALLNMTRVVGSHDIAEPVRSQIDRILADVGMTWQHGQAVASLAQWARSEGAGRASAGSVS
jgi:hypothetical protein